MNGTYLIKNPILKILATLVITILAIIFVSLFALSGIASAVIVLIILAILLLVLVWYKEIKIFIDKFKKPKLQEIKPPKTPLTFKKPMRPVKRMDRF